VPAGAGTTGATSGCWTTSAGWSARSNGPRLRGLDAETKALARKNLATWRSQNIGPVPDVVDPARRQQARRASVSLRNLLRRGALSALVGGPPPGDRQDRAAVKEAACLPSLMPRGSGKTTLARLSALWAVLGGYRPFVCLIGGSQERAVELLTPIRKAILENRCCWPTSPRPPIPCDACKTTPAGRSASTSTASPPTAPGRRISWCSRRSITSRRPLRTRGCPPAR